MNREVYLGDRGILGIEINSWTSEVRVKNRCYFILVLGG